MFRLISYDIVDDKRRTKVMKFLLGYGARVQYSVFECNLKPREINDLRNKLKKWIESEDSVRFYFLGAEDVKRIERLGDARTVEDRIFIMH